MKRTSLFLCLVCLSATAMAEKAYQWMAEDGSVMFSKSPPSGVDYKEIELQQPENIIEQDSAQRNRLLNKSNQMDQQSRDRRQQKKELQQKIKELKKALKQAEQALIDAETPQAGDVQRLSSGHTRLRPIYFERQEALKKTVTEHEQEIKKLRKQLRELH